MDLFQIKFHDLFENKKKRQVHEGNTCMVQTRTGGVDWAGRVGGTAGSCNGRAGRAWREKKIREGTAKPHRSQSVMSISPGTFPIHCHGPSALAMAFCARTLSISPGTLSFFKISASSIISAAVTGVAAPAKSMVVEDALQSMGKKVSSMV